MNIYLRLAAVLAVGLVSVSGQQTRIKPRNAKSGAKSVGDVLTGSEADVGVNLGPRTAFKKVSRNANVTKWTQTIGGVPVYGSVLTTREDQEGFITQVEGFVSETASFVDTTPSISGDVAVNKLMIDWKHNNRGNHLAVRLDTPELQILESESGFDTLVWKVAYFVDWGEHAIRGSQPVGEVPAYITGLVNAHTGRIERSWNSLQLANIQAITGNSKIGKSYHTIDVEKSGETCKHRDSSRFIEVFDLSNKLSISSLTTSSFKCDVADDDNWDLFESTSGYSPRNEVYLHATRFVDLWFDFMGAEVKPFHPDSNYLKFYTHYAENYENAFFDGNSFKFGDGKNVFFPLTTLDIVCHEIGHSVTQWHGGKMEYRQQPGAMNEAYADIVGATCNHHYKYRTDGLIGADAIRPGTYRREALRNMCDPPSIGSSVDHMNNYHDGVGVHYASGIYNKAWCTLKNTSGWDYVKAFQVFTDANLLYWSYTTKMNCGACGVESAAAGRGYSKADVTAAFNVVGVSCTKC